MSVAEVCIALFEPQQSLAWEGGFTGSDPLNWCPSIPNYTF